ncbi:MAG TPA: DUF1343 domain-containing protein [Melioribacteraceae bacterium]|nr:DUF1343 domain-containing protein [Melioribacteraceae bacterium]
MKINIIIFFLFCSFIFGQVKVKTGIEVLRDNNFDILKNKRIGLVTNPTGVDSKLKSTIDILFEAESVNLVALFGPEHGVRGDYAAGEYVDFYKDEKTGLPVYSLYGKTRKPNKDMLNGIDAIVYDIQDIGCRSYTYISTMGLLMEAASENNIEIIVLDRPNPLGGIRIEGNYAEPNFISFVSQFSIPYVYGLTCGELANYLNNEGLLKDKAKCSLTVIPMEGWKREMSFEETGLEWVPTSPHIPHKDSPFYYVLSGILGELDVISIGVGYTIPFQTFAAKWINGNDLANNLNSLNLPGVIFRPVTYKPYYAVYKGETINGVQIHITDFEKVNLTEIQFYFMQVHNILYPDKNIFEMSKSRHHMFDKVSGSDNIRKLFSKNYKFDEIKEYLFKDVEDFRTKSKKYFMY